MEKRHQHLSDLSTEILRVSEFAIALEDYEKALEWLERGRGLVWSQLNRLRTPLDELRSHNPTLADRLTSVSQELEAAGGRERNLAERLVGTDDQHRTFHKEEMAHVKLAEEYEQLIDEVRAIPGLENFLRPFHSSGWCNDLLSSGPVVTLVYSKHTTYCNALVLCHGLQQPLHIPLPQFSPKMAERFQRDLRSALRHSQLLRRVAAEEYQDGEQSRTIRPLGSSKKSSSKLLRDILRELWNRVVKPILDYLAFSVSFRL